MEGGAPVQQDQQSQQSQMTQEQINEMQIQIRLNEDYQNQLRQEIEEATPFISDVTPIDILKAEYADNFKFSDCFEELQKRYKSVRRLRRDGNCFYRAYLFHTFEAFIINKDTLSKQYLRFLKAIEQSKADLMALGYDEIAIEDFYDLFLAEVKKLPMISPAEAQSHLLKLLCNKEEAVYLIMYARFMTACYLKQNSFLFEDFVGDVASFCMREVEAVDVECD